MSRISQATDNFNRALGALGANWTNHNTGIRGDVTINGSNQTVGAFSGAGNDHPIARWVGAGTFTNDQYSSIKLAGLSFLSAAIRIGVSARQGSGTDAAATGYEAYVCCDGAGTYTTVLALRNGATYTTLNSATVAWVNGDTCDIECQGTTIRLCKNGTPLGGAFTVTDATLSTGLPGIVNTANVNGDDWDGGSISSGGIFTATITETGAAVTAQSETMVSAAARVEAATATDTVNGVRPNGTVTSPNPLKNNSVATQASRTGIVTVILDVNGNFVVRASAQATNGSGFLALTDPAIVAGQSYHMAYIDPSTHDVGITSLVTAT